MGGPNSLALLTVGSAVVGVVTLGDAPRIALTTALAVAAVAFIYLVVEELLMQAHERGETAGVVMATPAPRMGFTLT